MERYYTAKLELVTFDEDVIAASVATNSTNSTGPICWFCDADGLVTWYEDADGVYSINYSAGTPEYDEYCG